MKMTPQELGIATEGARRRKAREAEDLAFAHGKGIITTTGGKHNLCGGCYHKPCICLPDGAPAKT